MLIPGEPDITTFACGRNLLTPKVVGGGGKLGGELKTAVGGEGWVSPYGDVAVSEDVGGAFWR